MFKDTAKLYISATDIGKKCAELGALISKNHKGQDLVLLAVLKGSIVFFADLVRHITIPFEKEFVQLSSYGHGTETSGSVKVLKDVTIALKGKHVVVVEDILDTGVTLTFFTKHLKNHSPASVQICTLLDKPSRRRAPITADYCGFTIEDDFVVGYGLDVNELCRNYPDIYQVQSS